MNGGYNACETSEPCGSPGEIWSFSDMPNLCTDSTATDARFRLDFSNSNLQFMDGFYDGSCPWERTCLSPTDLSAGPAENEGTGTKRPLHLSGPNECQNTVPVTNQHFHDNHPSCVASQDTSYSLHQSVVREERRSQQPASLPVQPLPPVENPSAEKSQSMPFCCQFSTTAASKHGDVVATSDGCIASGASRCIVTSCGPSVNVIPGAVHTRSSCAAEVASTLSTCRKTSQRITPVSLQTNLFGPGCNASNSSPNCHNPSPVNPLNPVAYNKKPVEATTRVNNPDCADQEQGVSNCVFQKQLSYKTVKIETAARFGSFDQPSQYRFVDESYFESPGGAWSSVTHPGHPARDLVKRPRMAKAGQSSALGDMPLRGDMDDDLEMESLDDDRSMRGGGGGGGAPRLNHSEIEKRRRDKMNLYIVELAKLVPMCHEVNRKMDKLTVLRMAVQHIKGLRGESNTRTEVSHLPSFVTDALVKDLILQAADGFTFAISCDRGKILYASESTKSILNYKQDISKVKDQLATNDFLPKECYIDTKTMKLIKTRVPQAHLQLRSGGRRLFVCRMKKNVTDPEPSPVPPSGIHVKQELDASKVRSKRKIDKRNYLTILCMGYIKPWVMTKSPSATTTTDDDDNDTDNEAVNLNSLIAVGLPLGCGTTSSGSDVPVLSESELRQPFPTFMSRHTVDGKFSFVDHRVTSVLGYVPQELTGTSIYEYCHRDSVDSFAELHKQVLKTQEKVGLPAHRFRAKDGTYVTLAISAKVFCNPWTKEREQVVCTHRLIQECSVTSSSEDEPEPAVRYGSEPAAQPKSFYTAESPHSSSASASKCAGAIGRKIADEAYREMCASGKFFSADSSTKSSSPAGPGSTRAAGPTASKRLCTGAGISSTTSGSSSQRDSSSGTETTDEAAMAMIMNLLEADAGLGGPVDFNNLPWPL